jgi:uncharacterized membrane protein YeaQ/YmgE (transglycosylase-associated protein family)
MWPQAQDLLQHGMKIGLLMTRVVGVVGADTFPKIAMRLVETLTQNPGAGLQIGAEIVAQRGPISTVPFVLWLTAPSEPPSTLRRITRMAGGT